jgi:hypothetical protein
MAIFELPYNFVIPHTLFENELVGLTEEERVELLRLGMEVRELDGSRIQDVHERE